MYSGGGLMLCRLVVYRMKTKRELALEDRVFVLKQKLRYYISRDKQLDKDLKAALRELDRFKNRKRRNYGAGYDASQEDPE
jgi:hypothetical protein